DRIRRVRLPQSCARAMHSPMPPHRSAARARYLSGKPQAYLINIGRGPLIDEAALVNALREHKIAGAALDVFDQEPLPGDSPLWDVENLLVTPHTAGMAGNLWQRHYVLFSENVRRFLAGEPLLGVVDKQRGY